MTIPEAQIETWSRLGAVTTSKDTYATIKRALESPNTAFAIREFKVFLQGSYGNDTNIFKESDVDIVICYTSAFFYDLDHLAGDQQNLFKTTFANAAYSYSTFKSDVQTALIAAFGNSVQPSRRAFKIAANGPLRSSDVVCAFRHRRYIKFNGGEDWSYYEGITFETSEGTRIHNFPEYHSQNLTAKHQVTGSSLKPMIRVFKNMRSKMIERGLIANGEAPSYFIEGLLYNIPNDLFAGSLSDTTFNILTWLHQTEDRTQFVCANQRYYLLRDSGQVCWPTANGQKFINGAITLWNNW